MLVLTYLLCTTVSSTIPPIIIPVCTTRKFCWGFSPPLLVSSVVAAAKTASKQHTANKKTQQKPHHPFLIVKSIFFVVICCCNQSTHQFINSSTISSTSISTINRKWVAEDRVSPIPIKRGLPPLACHRKTLDIVHCASNELRNYNLV